MNRFEDLPANVRALLLAKLAMELKTHRCANLYDLAKKRNRKTEWGMAAVWRDICRLSRQPVCTIPRAGTPGH